MQLSGKLTFNRIAIKSIEIPKTRKSGIVLPDSKFEDNDAFDMYEDHPLQGFVVGVGKDVTSCKAGDIVLIKGNSRADKLMDNGTLYLVIYEQDVLLVRENGGSDQL